MSVFMSLLCNMLTGNLDKDANKILFQSKQPDKAVRCMGAPPFKCHFCKGEQPL